MTIGKTGSAETGCKQLSFPTSARAVSNCPSPAPMFLAIHPLLVCCIRITTLQVLSEGWTSAIVNGNLVLIKVHSGTADKSIVLYLVSVLVDFTWRVRRGEREVPRECELLIGSPELLQSVEAVTQILQLLDGCKLCVGNEDECFSELIAWRGGKFMDRSDINNSYVVLL